MGKLPDIVIFANDPNIISSFSTNSLTEKCNLHLANKNDFGLSKLKMKKYNLIGLSIESNSPDELRYFDKVLENSHDVPILIISPFYKENYKQIFGNKINKFIEVPFDENSLCKKIMNVILCKVESPGEEDFSGKLDKKKLLMLFKLSREFSAIDNTSELFYTISIRTTEAFGAERATVFVLNKNRTELISRVAIGMNKRIIRVPVGKGVVGRVIQTGKTYITNDPKSSPYFNDEFDKNSGFVTKNIICVPLKNIKDKIIGAFELINKNTGGFTKEDQFYLETMSSTIAVALENTLLHHFMKRQVHEYQILKKQLINLKKTSSSSKAGLDLVDEIISKSNSLSDYDEVIEKLDKLRKMLKGNTAALDCIQKIEDYVTDSNSLIREIVKSGEKVLE